MTDEPNAGASPGTAVVTGASSGIGAAYADRLARRGYGLILLARRKDKLEQVAQTIGEAHGVAVEIIAADLGLEQDLNRVVSALAGDERITMLVNNAGMAKFAPAVDTSLEAVKAMTDLNITALVTLTLAVLPGLKRRRRGTIVNIASIAAFGELPVSAVYSATKSYVLSFTRGLHHELLDMGIRVQAVLPGPTATDLWDGAGIPLASLDPAKVMSTAGCVDAALAGLDKGEAITLPLVEDAPALLTRFDEARFAILASAQQNKPASSNATVA